MRTKGPDKEIYYITYKMITLNHVNEQLKLVQCPMLNKLIWYSTYSSPKNSNTCSMTGYIFSLTTPSKKEPSSLSVDVVCWGADSGRGFLSPMPFRRSLHKPRMLPFGKLLDDCMSPLCGHMNLKFERRLISMRGTLQPVGMETCCGYSLRCYWNIPVPDAFHCGIFVCLLLSWRL